MGPSGFWDRREILRVRLQAVGTAVALGFQFTRRGRGGCFLIADRTRLSSSLRKRKKKQGRKLNPPKFSARKSEEIKMKV